MKKTVSLVLSGILIICLFAGCNSSTNLSKLDVFNQYENLIKDYENEYGKASYFSPDGSTSGSGGWSGLILKKLVDFNNDGTDELILVHQAEKISNKNWKELQGKILYTYEVWGVIDNDYQQIVTGATKAEIEIITHAERVYLHTSEDGTVDRYEGFTESGTFEEFDSDEVEKIIAVDNSESQTETFHLPESNDEETIMKQNAETDQEIQRVIEEESKKENNDENQDVSEQPEIQDVYAPYRAVLEDAEKEHGVGVFNTERMSDGAAAWYGVCFADLIDFNNDGNEELLLVYQTEEDPVNHYDDCIFVYEVWGLKDDELMLLDSDQLSGPQDDDVNWLDSDQPVYGSKAVLSVVSLHNIKFLVTYKDTWDRYATIDQNGDFVVEAETGGGLLVAEWKLYNDNVHDESFFRSREEYALLYGFWFDSADDAEEIQHILWKTKKQLWSTATEQAVVSIPDTITGLFEKTYGDLFRDKQNPLGSYEGGYSFAVNGLEGIYPIFPTYGDNMQYSQIKSFQVSAVAADIGALLPGKESYSYYELNDLFKGKLEAGTSAVGCYYALFVYYGNYYIVFESEKDFPQGDAKYTQAIIILNNDVLETEGMDAEVEEALEAYQSFLEEYDVYESEYSDTKSQFQIAYIDEDPIPELLIVDGTSHSTGVKIYTYENGSVGQVKSSGETAATSDSSGNAEIERKQFGSYGRMPFVSKENLFESSGTFGGITRISYYKIENGSAQKVKEFYTNKGGAPEDEVVFKIDNQLVSEESYEEQLDEFNKQYSFISAGYETYGTTFTTTNINLLLKRPGLFLAENKQ